MILFQRMMSLFAIVLFLGCASDPLAPTSAVADRPLETADRPLAAIDPGGASASSPTSSAGSIDPETFRRLLAELKELSRNDPQAHAELIELVESTDPALLGSLLNVWKSTLKYEQTDTDGELAHSETTRQPLAHSTDSEPSELLGGADASATDTDLEVSAEPLLGPVTTTGYKAPAMESPDDHAALRETVEPFAAELPHSAEVTASFATLADSPKATWEDYLHELITHTEEELNADSDTDVAVEKHLYLRLLYLMAGMSEAAQKPIPGLEPSEQEFWTDTLLALTDHFDHEGLPEGPDRARETVHRLTQAIGRLQERVPLEIHNLAFCQRIQSFGNYQPFPEHPHYEFYPGQPVLLYCEVENFHSQSVQDQYRTLLRSAIEIVDEFGTPVWQQEFEPTEDLCRNRRRDYFHTYSFNIPINAPNGQYTLKLTLADQLADKTAEASVSFRIRKQ